MFSLFLMDYLHLTWIELEKRARNHTKKRSPDMESAKCVVSLGFLVIPLWSIASGNRARIRGFHFFSGRQSPGVISRRAGRGRKPHVFNCTGVG